MIKFFTNIKKYYHYALYQAKAELKSEVTNSYLNWIWWFLEPTCLMLIYTFIVQVVFKTNEQYFPIFVYLGLTTWDLFNRNVSSSVKTIKNNIGTINKVYVPKYIFILSKSFVYLFKFFVAFIVIIGLMIAFKVPFSFQTFNFPLILIVIYTISFGISCILLHFGVFVDDLSNVTNILLRLLFYFSGIFYNIITRIPKPYNIILSRINPVAFIITQFRKIFIYNLPPNYLGLIIWEGIGILMIIIGIHLIDKYENSYAKVV